MADDEAIKEIEELKNEIALGKEPSAEPPHVLEFTGGEASIGISMLDLAEILDQHKQWVESGGEIGVKADLCGVNLAKADLTGVNLQGAHLHRVNLAGADLSMANLRGASLVRASLHNANLLGTELRGANLMGANLYGTDGLWFGRLGGTNLFDAVLPESISAVDSSKAIGDATKVARWFYFLTMGVSVLCLLLIAYTRDDRLVLNASALPIGIFGNFLSMASLYLGGPLLLLILSLRFHFLLLRLWGSMAALPAVFPDGQTLEKDGPWYLMGLVRRHFRWQGESRAAMTLFEAVLSTVLAYWIVPATLFFFWLRYLTRQDFRGTLLHVFLMTVSVATATSVPFVVSRVLRPGEIRRQKSKNVWRITLRTTRAALAVGLILFVISVGVNRGLPSDHSASARESAADPRRWAALRVRLAYPLGHWDCRRREPGYRWISAAEGWALAEAGKGVWGPPTIRGSGSALFPFAQWAAFMSDVVAAYRTTADPAWRSLPALRNRACAGENPHPAELAGELAAAGCDHPVVLRALRDPVDPLETLWVLELLCGEEPGSRLGNRAAE